MVAFLGYRARDRFANGRETARPTIIRDMSLAPQIIAHRTYARVAPENSLAGLEACIRAGVPWAEIDIRRTRDGQHVLMHDLFLGRTTNSRGRVAQCTWPQVREMIIGTNPADGAPLHVPHICDAFSAARGKLKLYLDCRTAEPVQLAAEIRAAGIARDVLVCAYGRQAAAFRAADAEIPLVLYAARWSARLVRRVAALAPVVLETHAHRLTEELVDRARLAGVACISLTLGALDTPANWQRAAERGAALVMTDRPAEALSAVCGHETKTDP